MSDPAAVVSDSFSQARTYAASAMGQLAAFTSALNTAIAAPPSVTFSLMPTGTLDAVTIPDAPSIAPPPAWETGTTPSALTLSAPDLTIDDFTDVAPVITIPATPTIDVGTAPEVSYGVAPVVPDIATITVPDAPVLTMPDVPVYLALNTPTFAGIDLHSDYLANLQGMPLTLDLVAPTPYSYTPSPKYTSALLTALESTLLTRLSGGTGLAPAVEQALWDRARSRELSTARADEAEIDRLHEAAGFTLPTGALFAARRRAAQATSDKVSGLSRDVAIKQAELEQENLKQTIASGIDLEGKMIDMSLQLERLAFESAAKVAENAVQIYNAQLDEFKVLYEGYRTYAATYDTLIKGEMAKVDAFRGQIAGEQAKADANRTLVEQYKAGIDASLALVKVYEAQVGGARARMEMESTRISAVGEQIKAFVATINGETAKVEAYKVGVQAKTLQLDAFKTAVEGQVAVVQTYEAKARAFAAKAGAQGERARAQLAYYTGRVQAYSAEWDGYRAQQGAQASMFQAYASSAGAQSEAFKAAADAAVAKSHAQTAQFEAQTQSYIATQTYTINAQKMNADVLLTNRQIMLDAAKTGAQVYAQLAASAYGMIHASAAVSATAQDSVSYSYSNDTTGPAPTLTTT